MPRFLRCTLFSVATLDRDHGPYARIAFPLASDGETVDMPFFVFNARARLRGLQALSKYTG